MIKYFLIICGSVLLTILIVSNFLYKKTSFTPKEYKENDLNLPTTINNYSKEDTLLFEFHYYKIIKHFQEPFFRETPYGFIYRSDDALKEYYLKNYFLRYDSLVSQIGEYSLGLYHLYKKQYDLSYDYLKKVKNQKLININYAIGTIYMQDNNYVLAENHFKKEIELNGNFESAYINLIKTLNILGKDKELFSLLYNSNTKKYFFSTPYLAGELYLKNGNIFNYLKSSLKINTNTIGFIGAFLITIVWLIFLRKVDVFKKNPLISHLATLVLGMIFTFVALILYDIFRIYFNFNLNGNILNDLFFSIFGIGVIEEIVKIIPLLIVLNLTKQIKEPIDYIIYASCSALGFAFVENLIKFKPDKIDIIDIRGFVCVISHVFDTSIIAYGLILAKYKNNGNSIKYFIVFLLLAALSHGFYDFWLLNESARYFYLFTYAYMLTSMLILTSFINNALNNSPFFNPDIDIDSTSIKKYLIGGLTTVTMFVYLCNAFLYGSSYANGKLYGGIFFVGFFIAFLSSNLSNFDIVKNHWGRINFADYSKKLKFNNIIGKRIKISALGNESILSRHLPVEGLILFREKFSEDTDYLNVKLDHEIKINGKAYNNIFIKSKNADELISTKNKIIVYFLVPTLEVLPDKKSKKDLKFIDWAVASP